MRKLRKVWMDQEAVSPVIAVILMVAITVVLAAVLYMWVQSFVPTGKSTPRGTFVVSKEGDNYVLSAAEFERAIAGGDVRFQLMNPTRQVIATGELDEIYNKALRNPVDGTVLSHLSWRDTNSDDKLSTGDAIFIMSSENDEWNGDPADPGIAEDDWIFRVIFKPTGDVITETVLQ